ncbi:MAG: S-methyl-5-thioribose-1-phosphate isomerase [Chloroflexota bacterium]
MADPGIDEHVPTTDDASGGVAPPRAPQPAAADAPTVDLARRRFFRQFAGEVLQTAVTVAGAASAFQRASAEAAATILDPTRAVLGEDSPSALPASGPTGFRTPFREEGDALLLIDQRRLPEALVEHACRSGGEVAWAIREMVVRGAPAIGQVAAIGMALTADKLRDSMPYARRATMRAVAKALLEARPTAVNLRWAVDRVMARYEAVGDLSDDGDAIADAIRAEVDAIVFEATDDHGRLAQVGFEALPDVGDRPLRVLTHCNTGPLACGQFGTALGVVQVAHHAGREVHVWVDETRPYLQGARLTAWELAQAGVPHTLIADSAAGFLMSRGEVDVILVGADRVAANGDTANKLGTYPLAVLAARHGIPFYVCAPLNSVDLETPDGDAIPIEERAAEEVSTIRGVAIAPPGTPVRNPAFDVTPAELVGAIVTDEGVVRAPFDAGLAAAVERSRARRASAATLTRPVVTPASPVGASGPD